MLSVYLAARELERRRARESAEFARQIPLYAEEIAHHPDPVMGDPENGEALRTEPGWASNY